MEDSMFIDFNRIPSQASEFEELYAVRRDLGSLLKSLCKSCGATTIYQLLGQHLSQAVQCMTQFRAAAAGGQQNNDESITVYLDIECLLFCTTQLARCIEAAQLAQIKDVIVLVQSLIDVS